ncbi:dihydrofolate reductase [uncultured Roseobacter sp.]|uniref:dihydrofolate reductase n=1 Tax=uncultured Roseobacter sp. TaxID=114847 RepID=UPI0026333B37|nr:dihydrofolate reductase [uncultured Roseobacter sp.]
MRAISRHFLITLSGFALVVTFKYVCVCLRYDGRLFWLYSIHPEGTYLPHELALSVAISRKGVIGHNGGVPWSIPDDLRRFYRISVGKPVIIGFDTWRHMPKPLPRRRTIVLAEADKSIDGAFHAHSQEMALNEAERACQYLVSAEAIVAGGANVYEQFLPQCTKIYMTEILFEGPGDTYFPQLLLDEWRVHDESPRRECAVSGLLYQFKTMYRREK